MLFVLISTSLFCLLIAGTKEKVATRIAKKKLDMTPTDEMIADVAKYLKHTIKTKKEEKPTINQAYASSFNLVDRFNRLLSTISFRPRITSEDLRLLIGAVEICLVQAWLICNDIQQIKFESKEREEESLVDFVKILCVELNQN